MRILLLSLLRLGDVVLHRQVVQNLKRQYPQAQIHMLIHSQFLSVQQMLPEVDQWHDLDRNDIQKILVERRQSPIAAFEKLQAVVDNLNAQKFDMVMNLTHNRFSVRLMDLIQAPEKRGVSLSMGRKADDANPWQTYLNENFSDVGGSRFHYLEVLQRSLGIDVGIWPTIENRYDKCEAPLILLQLLTSDAKKNWGLQRFHELKQKLQIRFPQARVLGICSPQEKVQVEKIFAWNEFLTPALDEAASLFKQAKLLVTGDTSIQHIAAQQGCPVLSLFLGSADPVKTFPWQSGAWVMQGQAPCAPCSHSAACHQASHLCAENLQVENVFTLAIGILNGEKTKLFSSNVRQVQPHRDTLTLQAAEPDLLQILEHETWWRYLHGTNVADLPPVSLQELKTVRGHHEKFCHMIHLAKAGQIEISQVETLFPFWQDSLTRWKRGGLGMSTETEALCHIRNEILNQNIQSLENENVRYAGRPASQERLAEA